jgi:regulator of replication initiation timing
MDAKEMEDIIFRLNTQVEDLDLRISIIIKRNDKISEEMENLKKYMEYMVENLDSAMQKINGMIDISENPEWEIIKNKIEDGILNLKKFTDDERLA